MLIQADAISKLSKEHFLKLCAEVSPPARRQLILARAHADPAFFAAQFLPQYTRLPFATFHRTLFNWHRRMALDPLQQRRGLRYALAAPRGSAKSTIVSLILPLHDIIYRTERYIVLISATERQAAQRLRAIRTELTNGPLSPIVGQVRATRREIEARGVRIEVYGAGSEMRGIAQRAWRPSKIILDDAESSAAADSHRRRTQLLDWFAEVVSHLGDNFTHILAIGTVLHPKGLLASLFTRPDFESMRLRSIDAFPTPDPLWEQWEHILRDRSREDPRGEARAHFLAHRTPMEKGTHVLWREKEDIEQLVAQLHTLGRHAFHQEKQNQPFGPEDALFDPATVTSAVIRGDTLAIGHWENGYLHEQRRIPHATRAQRFGYLDSALGKSRTRGDFAALAVVLAMGDGTLFAESLTCRRIPPTRQIAHLFELHTERPFIRVGIEATAFQQLLLLAIEQEKERRKTQSPPTSDLPVTGINPTARKETRIASLEPLLANGPLVLSPALDEEFWIELANHPRCEHDDALDALAGAVELARSATNHTTHHSIIRTTKPHRQGLF